MVTQRFQVVTLSADESVKRVFSAFCSLDDAIREMNEIEAAYKYSTQKAYGVYDIVNEEVVCRNKTAEDIHYDHTHMGSGYLS